VFDILGHYRKQMPRIIRRLLVSLLIWPGSSAIGSSCSLRISEPFSKQKGQKVLGLVPQQMNHFHFVSRTRPSATFTHDTSTSSFVEIGKVEINTPSCLRPQEFILSPPSSGHRHTHRSSREVPILHDGLLVAGDWFGLANHRVP